MTLIIPQMSTEPKTEWDEIVKLAGGWSSLTEEELYVTEQLRHRSGKTTGQGFGLSAAERKTVEDHAMNMAINYFNKTWDEVLNVSSTASYDLLCRNKKEELRVEVKGTTGIGNKIILTKKEFLEASTENYGVFVVTEIELKRDPDSVPLASGGICTYFSPWDMKAHKLEPISFSCELDWSKGIEIGMGL